MIKVHHLVSACQSSVAPSPVIAVPAPALEAEEKQPSHSTEAGVYCVKLNTIPPSLKALPDWIHWKIEQSDKGKPTKVPYVAGGQQKAAADNPQTWESFEAAVTLLKDDRGLGVVLPLSGEIFFVDLDHVRNQQTGEIAAWASRIIKILNSYTEISPSGTGTHTLGLVHDHVPPEGLHKKSIEFYTKGRYATMTGNHLADTPLELGPVDVTWLYRLIKADVFTFEDNSKFANLFNNVGDQWKSEGYVSHSEADLALCALLAQKLDSVEDIDCAFRLSGLMRKKWDSKRGDSTYGRNTILKALKQNPNGDFLLTDLGNAKRLFAQHGHDLHFCHQWNKWFIWDGTRFQLDDSGEIERRAKNTVISLYDQGKKSDDDSAPLKWAILSQSRGRLAAMVDLAKTEVGIPIKPDLLDANPWLLNCKNGTLDLRTGILRPHERKDLCTKRVPVAFDPEAKCPIWQQFLNRIMGGNTNLISFLQRAVGYSLTGSLEEHVFFIQYGLGRNGKSTFSETINRMVGDYAKTADASLLLIRRNEGPRNDVARLAGARLVLTSEIEAGGRLAEGLVKQLTGGDKVSARFLYCEAEEFDPTFKIWLRTNNKPQIRGTDNAIWKRVKLIPFNVTIPDEEQDKKLGQKLDFELPGILAWAVRGCLDWQKNGLGAPPEVIEATETYKKESDVLGEFIEDRCNVAKEREVLSKNLYEAYQEWCSENGMLEKQIMSSVIFGKLLTDRGIGKRRDNKNRYRTGIDLKNVVTDGVTECGQSGVTNMPIPNFD